MKTLILKTLFIVAALACLLVGLMVATFGSTYFLLLDPQKNWMEFMQSIVPEKRWLFAAMMTFCGMFTAIVPLMLFTFWERGGK